MKATIHVDNEAPQTHTQVTAASKSLPHAVGYLEVLNAAADAETLFSSQCVECSTRLCLKPVCKIKVCDR